MPNLQVSADPPEDVVDTVSGQQRHKHVLQTNRQVPSQGPQSMEAFISSDVCTFCPVSMVIARPLGTRPAVLCFLTSRTDTTGIQTCPQDQLVENREERQLLPIWVQVISCDGFVLSGDATGSQSLTLMSFPNRFA